MARTSKKKQEIRKKPVKIYYVGIYARLSVDSGDRKNESIETQVEIIKAFIAQHDDMVIYGVYTDLGKTGTSFEREGFERMMRDVRARKIDCIIVKDLSGLAGTISRRGIILRKYSLSWVYVLSLSPTNLTVWIYLDRMRP